MRKALYSLCLLWPVLFYAGQQPVDYVDPFICTQDDHGHWLPAALVPFGLIELCPDSYPSSLTGDGDWAHSGYNYRDAAVRGFSHLHKGSSGGTAIYDRAGLLSFMPVPEAVADSFYINPVLQMDKSSEQAQAGYYGVNLEQGQIKVELTATAHTGSHRYTFASGQSAKLFIFAGNRSRAQNFSCRQLDDKTLAGVLTTGAGTYHFHIVLADPVKGCQSWDGQQLNNTAAVDRKVGGLLCDFGRLDHPLEVRIGLSLTSQEAAQQNLQAENPQHNFARIRKQARTLWNDQLKRIQVQGSEEHKKIFYTALYHCCFLPVTLTDVAGTYPGLDMETHHAQGYVHYGDYAFWDAFRTAWPLYTIWLPELYRDFMFSLRDHYQQAQDWSPYPECDHKPHGALYQIKGKNGRQVHSTCRHEHMLMSMIDGYFKGLCDFDIRTIYPHIKQEALLQMPERYDRIGFLPARPDQSCEYSWDNWCIAQLAKALGETKDYDYFSKRAQYWKNSWDPSLRFFRARAEDGSWMDFPEDPTVNREKYTYEGSKWQLRWNVVHDPEGLIKLFGGRDEFLQQLRYFFVNDLYTAGNQIDLHAPYLFNIAGAPWLTQEWVYRIMAEPIVQRYGTHTFFPEPIFDRVYKATPDGYLEEMDDDYGCMAGWFAMSAMGLYQICPGDPVYQLTTPLFERVQIGMEQGRTMVIEARGLSAKNRYIQSARLQDAAGRERPWSQSCIDHKTLMSSSKLVYEMGPQPNKAWGVQTAEEGQP